jgi:hypothetical protein
VHGPWEHGRVVSVSVVDDDVGALRRPAPG